MRTIEAGDLYCGGGGTSQGLVEACEDIGAKVNLLAINHWQIAVDTHKANHPWARHLCKSLDEVDPRKEVKSGKLDLLVASPECTHHSSARGGKPVSDQMRASAWQVVDWLAKLSVGNLLIENVKEFRDWGPIYNGKPIKSRKGEIYRSFLTAIRSLGYTVEDRILCSADYGDPTTRERLFVMARRRGKIRWPDPSHSQTGATGKQWRSAREIIDWSIQGRSIFNRPRPLAKNTMARIEAGIRKFGGPLMEPFLVIMRNHSVGRSLDRPVPTITATGGGHIAICQPFLIPWYGERPGQGPRTHSIDNPMPVIPASANKFGLIEPFILHVNHGATHGRGNGSRTRSIGKPLPTVTASHGMALVESFLVKYNGTGGVCSVHDPLDTVTAKDRFGLVVIDGQTMKLDIRLRMLQPHELAAAMGFPEGYQFTGKRTHQIRQIGNAVSVSMARALCGSLLAA